MKKNLRLMAFFLLMVSMFTTSLSFFGRKPKTTVLRLSDNQPEGYPTVMAGRDFAKYVEEGTEGKRGKIKRKDSCKWKYHR